MERTYEMVQTILLLGREFPDVSVRAIYEAIEYTDDYAEALAYLQNHDDAQG
jgi:uncharacterized protein (DUF433 family)